MTTQTSPFFPLREVSATKPRLVPISISLEIVLTALLNVSPPRVATISSASSAVSGSGGADDANSLSSSR